MSTELFRNQEYSIVRFYGGDKRGSCIQITPQRIDYIQLTKEEAKEFVSMINEFLLKE